VEEEPGSEPHVNDEGRQRRSDPRLRFFFVTAYTAGVIVTLAALLGATGLRTTEYKAGPFQQMILMAVCHAPTALLVGPIVGFFDYLLRRWNL
jgi:hypothetical protein